MGTDRRTGADEETLFLNVDVDVWAKSDLQPLVAALGKKVFVHYVGAEGAGQSAHFSLASGHDTDADTRIRRLAAVIEQLPPAARRLWNSALARDFNVGIQGGVRPFSHEVVLQESTVKLVARLRGRILITTYALPDQSPRPKRANRVRGQARRR